MLIWCSQQIINNPGGEHANDDRSAARHGGFEDMLGIVDLLNGDECQRVTAERRRVSAIAVEQANHIDANPKPCRECAEKENLGLDEHTNDGDRCRHAENRRNQPKDGFLQNLAAGGQREDCDRQCC
jgi:hypothetical protein